LDVNKHDHLDRFSVPMDDGFISVDVFRPEVG